MVLRALESVITDPSGGAAQRRYWVDAEVVAGPA